MSERAERRRHRLATGIFHQPVEEPICHSPDQALAGSSDVATAAPGARDEVVRQKSLPSGWQWAIQSPDEVVCERTRSNSERESWRLLTENVEDMRKSDFQADGWEAIQIPEKK